MKNEKLQDAIGMVGDDLIQEAERTEPAKKARIKWIALVAAMLSAIMVMGVGVAMHFNSPESKPVLPPMDEEAADDVGLEYSQTVQESASIDVSQFALSKAVYPERAANPQLAVIVDEEDNLAYEKWYSERDSFRADYNSLTPDLGKFITNSTKAFLADTKDNAIYSPVNVYMALSMLAETSAGESRAQILDALGYDSIEVLRQEANAVWNALYTDDGTAKTILANSIWLRDDAEYKTEALDVLAQNYYASSFEGRMGSKEYDKALQNWLNEQTDGMLDDQVNGIGMPDDTVLALASTLLFNGKWSEEFNLDLNTDGVFHGTEGEVKTEFMNESRNGHISVGDNFTAYSKNFIESGHMTFILPKEGMSPQELIATDEFAEFVLCGGRDSYMADYTDKPCWETQRYAIINFSMPKFDVSSQLDLTKDLDKLGITHITNENEADMSPITDARAYLDSMIHGARVTVDEKGCKAAAFTMMLCGATSAPLDEIDFVLDRPFVFVIGGYDGLPLFIGTVNNIN